MRPRVSRLVSVGILVMIIIYGILKIWVQRGYADLIVGLVDLLNLPLDGFLDYLQGFAKTEELKHQTIGWLIYYPTYFLLHIAFIYFLFSNNRKARNWLMLGLTTTIGLLIIFWQLFSLIDMHGLANFFRNQFQNLFGLPFILLAIEGGRILYQDLKNLTNS